MKYIVFTLDCISSKKIENVTNFLEERIGKMNQDVLRNNGFITPFTVMKGDEIQGVIRFDQSFMKNIRFLREACYPVKVRIGIGIGEIENEDDISLKNSWKLNGEAFHMARKSLEYLGEHKLYSKKPMSHVISYDENLDLVLNTNLLLYDTLLNKWNENTYEAVYLREKFGSFRNIIDESTGAESTYSLYTKRAARGQWSIVEEFESEMSKILNHIYDIS